ncbi:MAG: class I SAM-dependent methyltransferase [Candidatus Thermoplasmatota archaeon]|nr:class I SAM-dependent methyltransferase [Candidatus Thermoplasmatota archaeon]
MLNENEVEKYLKFYNSEFGKEVLKGELKFVESKLKNCKNVLSIGCGPASLETRLNQLHPEMNITGLDNSKEMLEHVSPSIHVEFSDAQHLKFDNNTFDAVLYVTSLEFIIDYKKSVKEAYRVLKNKGLVLILMLNPRSHYFKREYSDKSSYIRKNIKHVNTEKIRECISNYFFIKSEEYFLGIKDGKIFDSDDPKLASIYIVEGIKYDK